MENRYPTKKETYSQLIFNIGELPEKGRRAAIQSVNTVLVETYWHIGKQIVEYKQKGNEKAEYGSLLLKRLSKDRPCLAN